jgi:acyl-CoA synthetase (AMP-forming)/AMP-acid ligase II
MIVRSPFPDIAIPDAPLTEAVLGHVGDRRDKPALIDGASGRTLTYGQLADAVRAAAAGMAARGFRQGDVLATVCPSDLAFPVAFYAAAALGGATTMVNPAATVDEMAAHLADAGARFALAAPDRVAAVHAAAGGRLAAVFAIGEAPGAEPFAAVQSAGGELPRVAIDPAMDVAALPSSSGTTGRPKAVMLTHRNLVAGAWQWLAVDPVAADDVAVTIYPCFHVGGIICLNVVLAAGATLVILPRYDLRALLGLIASHHATRAILAPPVILDLVQHPIVAEHDLESLATVTWSAAPMGEDLATACRARLGCRVKQMYAMTEAVPAHYVPLGADDRPGSGGPPVPNSETRIVDPATGTDLGPGETGEIRVRGPQVMAGYRNRPDATAEAFDGEGWLRTGDLGYVDADGWIHVVDRLKELIKYKGYQVAPAELEAVLLTHPAVADAAVVPSPDERAGEVPKAFVVLAAPADPDEIMAFVAARVASHKKVRRLEVVDAIPKSASGKVLRRVLVAREREREQAAAAPVGV